MDRCLNMADSDGQLTVKETKMSAQKKVMFVDDEEGVRLAVAWERDTPPDRPPDGLPDYAAEDEIVATLKGA